MNLVDTHCHLQFENFKNQENAVISRASAAGVKKLICVGTDLADSEFAVELADRSQDVWASVGAHPHEADKFLADVNSPKKLRHLASQTRVVAVGETGLDYYKSTTEKADQKAVLKTHIEASLELGLPLIFHSRAAWSDFWEIFDNYSGIKGVLHSFTGGPKQLDNALSRGLYVALNGIVTFTKDEALLTAAKQVPLERLLLETDAPFLLPAGAKDSTCEPQHVRLVAEFLAELRGEELTKIAESTTANAVSLFGLMP